METEADDLLYTRMAAVIGVAATGPDGPFEIRAGLTVAADGRHSTLRDRSGLEVQDLGAPFDVLWLRLPVLPGDPVDLVGKVKNGQLFVMIYRSDYWQCAYLIPKGGFDAIKAEGLDNFCGRLKSDRGLRRRADRRRHHRFRSDQASDGDGGPAEELGAAGPGLHRRCRACHVAHRRRRHQSRHPGCGGDGEHAGAGAAARHARLRRPEKGAGPARISHQGDPGLPGRRPEFAAGAHLAVDQRRRSRPCSSNSSMPCRGCGNSRPASSAWACGPNM